MMIWKDEWILEEGPDDLETLTFFFVSTDDCQYPPNKKVIKVRSFRTI